MFDVEDVDLVRGDRTLLSHATWRLGPGDRVGIVGVNGAGKSSVLALLDGTLAPTAGRVKHGRTVVAAAPHPDARRPRSRGRGCSRPIESIRRVTRTATGEVTASAMLERFGFTGDKLTARIGDLSGGERRRFQLLRLLLTEPNVLLLDEPTNDLDIETLMVLEDFLDDWPGTLVVVSHDRYFLERVTDVLYGLLDDGQISLLPGGVDEYLARRSGTSPRPKGEFSATEVSGEVPLRGRETAHFGAGPGRQCGGAVGAQDPGPGGEAARADGGPRGRAERRGARARVRPRATG